MEYNRLFKARMIGRKRISDEKDITFSVQDKIENNFLKNKVHFLTGEIEDHNINKAIQWIIYENSLDDDKQPLMLYVNSIGGDLYQALGLIDTMRLSNKPVHTIGIGAVMSAAFLIFTSGEKGHRYITRNCGIMCHQYTDVYEGKHHDLKSFAKEAELTNKRMMNILQEATGMSERLVKSKLLTPSDVWMTSEEMVKLGVADHIL